MTEFVKSAAVLGEPVDDPGAWLPQEFAERSEWRHELSVKEIESLLNMAAQVREKIGNDPSGLLRLNKDAFQLGACSQLPAKIFEELKNGSGVMLVRGLPVAAMDPVDVATVYWGIGRHLGMALSNNPDGDMLGHVTDLGKTQDDPESRGYQTREAMDYHCDQSSIVGLICIREPKSGGISKISSSISVYNELLKRAPESVTLLGQPFCWTKHGETNENEPGFYQSPVFSILDGKLCTSFGPKHIFKGHALSGAPALTAAQHGAITAAEEIAEELHYEMTLKQGDMQFLNNFTALHTRTAYEDWPDAGRKRLLWRLWLLSSELRPETAYVKQWSAGVMLASTRQRIVL